MVSNKFLYIKHTYHPSKCNYMNRTFLKKKKHSFLAHPKPKVQMCFSDHLLSLVYPSVHPPLLTFHTFVFVSGTTGTNLTKLSTKGQYGKGNLYCENKGQNSFLKER